jgi:hypothetical protein
MSRDNAIAPITPIPAKNHAVNRSARRAERETKADLSSSLMHGERQETIHARERDDEREQRETVHEYGIEALTRDRGVEETLEG